MDIFTRNKFLLRIIFLLIFLNLILTGYLLMQKKGGTEDRRQRRGKEDSVQILKSKLNLSKDQERALLKLRADFAREEQEIVQLIRSQRDSMNAEMFHPETDIVTLKCMARRVAENEYRMELLRIEQSRELKNICTKEQLKEFQHLIINIRDFFQPQKKKE